MSPFLLQFSLLLLYRDEHYPGDDCGPPLRDKGILYLYKKNYYKSKDTEEIGSVKGRDREINVLFFYKETQSQDVGIDMV
jgi:hypothetical protein